MNRGLYGKMGESCGQQQAKERGVDFIRRLAANWQTWKQQPAAGKGMCVMCSTLQAELIDNILYNIEQVKLCRPSPASADPRRPLPTPADHYRRPPTNRPLPTAADQPLSFAPQPRSRSTAARPPCSATAVRPPPCDTAL